MAWKCFSRTLNTEICTRVQHVVVIPVTSRLVSPFRGKQIAESSWSASSKCHIVLSYFTAGHKTALLKYGEDTGAVHSLRRLTQRRRRDSQHGLHWLDSGRTPASGLLPRCIHCCADSFTWVDKHWAQRLDQLGEILPTSRSHRARSSRFMSHEKSSSKVKFTYSWFSQYTDWVNALPLSSQVNYNHMTVINVVAIVIVRLYYCYYIIITVISSTMHK